MSRRTLQYRGSKRSSVDFTKAEIISNHGHAKDLNGRSCSLPIKPAKAERIANVLHRKRGG